ncbi:YueI family protein [Lactiplantibacillus modestisalitolerans]|nr:YueI family protein [Lactiplantibacillus modestisalitolerans]
MSQSDAQLDKHLQTALFGTPVLHPDEQHRNLGTFHERIDLAITFTQALTRDYSAELQAEMAAHPDYQLLLHGLLDQDIRDRYVQLAAKQNVKFAIRNDLMYRHEPDSLAVALVATCAITPTTINIDQRFPDPQPAPHQSGDLLERIHHHLEVQRQDFLSKLK